jgi:hypothetical protein
MYMAVKLDLFSKGRKLTVLSLEDNVRIYERSNSLQGFFVIYN